ncbi:NAD(P)-dependent alcohol dehydrogenase [Streptomyces sp. NPDC059256]|uniref:NAD(P)-dependent alcohol dehydrogenase n=1 Tax=Streptomyces sp. NPDC059256 TaxID=3346794 RepID=UPI0036B4D570
MKAVLQDEYGPSDVLKLQDVERPIPKPGEVLIRIRAAALDAGVWHLMTGRPQLLRLMGFGVRRPAVRIRGREVAGQVEAVGAGVTRHRVGDEVFGFCEGAFAEYVSAPQDRFVSKPPNLPLDQAAALPISGVTALQALRDSGRVRPGQQVLIIGAAGGVGTFAVQLAKSMGATVTGVCSTAKTDLVRSLGACEVIDYTREDFAERPERYDLIIDTAGGRPLSVLRRALTPRGTLVIVGSETEGRLLGGTDRVLRALLISPFVRHSLRGLFSVERSSDLQILADSVAAGDLVPVIDRTFPLHQVPEAIAHLRDGHARGKVLIAPTP